MRFSGEFDYDEFFDEIDDSNVLSIADKTQIGFLCICLGIYY